MKRIYLIIPAVLLAIFGIFYWQSVRDAKAFAAEKAVAIAAAEKADLAKKAEIERKAREDANRRAIEREAEEKSRDAHRREKRLEEDRRIADDTARYQARVTVLSKENETLEKQVADLRLAREKLNKESFALAREVETARIAKRNAELEIQRLTNMVAARAGNTTLARTPSPLPLTQ